MIKKSPELARDKARKGLGWQYGAKWRHVAVQLQPKAFYCRNSTSKQDS
jgi:hypothetical protein